MNRLLHIFLGLGVLLTGTSLTAQEGFTPPKPGMEHEQLKKLEGTWDATVKMPGADKESKGTMTSKMELGGIWMVSNFKADFGGLPFEGKGMDTYDAAKKKYVGVWVDSMSTTPMVSEGTYDKDKKTLTMVADAPGPDGKPAKYRMVSEYKDMDNYTFTMYVSGKDGKENLMMTIAYKRKK